MPIMERIKTNHVGVYYVMGTSTHGKPEKIYYIMYRRGDKLIEEKAGRQFRNRMTASKASRVRGDRINGKPSNREKRKQDLEAKLAKDNIWTISKLWEEYSKGRDPKKDFRDQNRFEKHLKEGFGGRQPTDIDPLEVDKLRINLLKDKASGTVKNVLELLRRIINYGIKKRLASGPAFKIEMVKVNNLKTEDLNQEELSNLFKVIDDDSHPYAGPLMKCVLFTGMRRGELFNLQWTDIDEDKGFIFLRNPKGGQNERIPLNDGAKTIFDNLPESDSLYVFPGRDGEQRVDINKAVNRIKRAAGLPKDFRPLHGLRHVYASLLASSGRVDMYVLQKLLTHKSPAMTMRYAHLRDGALRKASNLADELINDAIQNKKEDGDKNE